MRKAILAGVVGVLACAPGYSVEPITASPAGVSYAYTHAMATEYPAVLQAAERFCGSYRKHAQPTGQPVRTSADRSVASFACVP